MHDINDQAIINQDSELLQKHLKLKVSQDKKFCQVYNGFPSCTKNLTKGRFVTVSSMSKSITSVFKVMYQII